MLSGNFLNEHFCSAVRLGYKSTEKEMIPMSLINTRKRTANGIVLLTTLLFIAISPITVFSSDANAYRTKHVIVAVMDGVRYSETFGDPQHRYVPKMWQELIPQGALYTNFYNQGVTVTRQGHSTIASGTWQVIDNGGPRLTMPTFFDYYRDETGVPAGKAWAIFGKASYSFTSYSSFPTYRDHWAPKFEIGIGESSLDDDQKVLSKIFSVMKEDKPGLIYANFGYTDHSAHVAPFAEYTKAVANVDDIFVKLWKEIQTDPEYRDSTTLILTNDHGRHDDAHGGYQSHGDTCAGCRHVFSLILGPDTKSGVTLTSPAVQIDINPTVGELLGFQTPLAQGRVLSESFLSCLGQNKKEPRTVAEKEAVHLQQLAQRDLNRVVIGNLQAKQFFKGLSATPETIVALMGVLSQTNKASGTLTPEQNILTVRAAREWLEATGDSEGLSALYRTIIFQQLYPGNISEQGYLYRIKSNLAKQLPIALATLNANSGSVFKPADRAFALMLLSHLAGNEAKSKTNGDLLKIGVNSPVIAEKLLRSLADPPNKLANAAVGAHQEALVLYALSDALVSLEYFQPGLPNRVPKVTTNTNTSNTSDWSALKLNLRQLCLLRYYRAIQEQPELGGLWSDPVDAMLYLISYKRLETAGLFKGFRSQKQLTLGKKQDEKSVLPEIVLNLSPERIQAWTTTSGIVKPVDENQLRRKISTQIWEHNQYLNFSREQTRYLVDETGQLPGDDQALAAGAFLNLWSPDRNSINGK